MDKGIEALIAKMLEQTKRFDNVHITESEAKQLITELKRLNGRNANLNSTLESWATDRAESAQRIAELEAAPNGMLQLSNELAEMKRKCVELPNEISIETATIIAWGLGCAGDIGKIFKAGYDRCRADIHAAGGAVEGSE